MRHINDIMYDINHTISLQMLIGYWNEIANNKKQYSLSKIGEAKVAISERIFYCDGNDLDKGKFYHHLNPSLFVL